MQAQEEIYRRIKIAGLISFIPLMLAASPLAGFFLGDFLLKKFHLPKYTLLLLISLGFISGIYESVRIIRLVLKINSKT